MSTFNLLGVLFVTLKLTGFIDWHWAWVTCPFWPQLTVFVIGFVIFVMFSGSEE